MKLRTAPVVRRRLTAEPGSGCTATRHGTGSSVRDHRCRCPDAVEERRLYRTRQGQGRLEPGHVDSTGATRRLQALNALGYSTTYLAGQLGSTQQYVARLLDGQKDVVHRATAGRIDEVYQALAGRPAMWNPDVFPDTTEARRESRIAQIVERAEGRGFVSPMRWDGDSIDDPAGRPEPVHQRSHRPAQDSVDSMRTLVASGADPGRVREAYRDLPRAHKGAVTTALSEGSTAAELAAMFGTTPEAVERRVAAHAEHRQDETAAAIEQARDAIEQRTADDELDEHLAWGSSAEQTDESGDLDALVR